MEKKSFFTCVRSELEGNSVAVTLMDPDGTEVVFWWDNPATAPRPGFKYRMVLVEQNETKKG